MPACTWNAQSQLVPELGSSTLSGAGIHQVIIACFLCHIQLMDDVIWHI
jgi:hypothetical protein